MKYFFVLSFAILFLLLGNNSAKACCLGPITPECIGDEVKEHNLDISKTRTVNTVVTLGGKGDPSQNKALQVANTLIHQESRSFEIAKIMLGLVKQKKITNEEALKILDAYLAPTANEVPVGDCGI